MKILITKMASRSSGPKLDYTFIINETAYRVVAFFIDKESNACRWRLYETYSDKNEIEELNNFMVEINSSNIEKDVFKQLPPVIIAQLRIKNLI